MAEITRILESIDGGDAHAAEDLLEKVRVFSEQILQQAQDNPESRREMARIHRRLGRLAWYTGQDAEPACQRSLSIFEDLSREFPSNPDYRADLGESHIWLSRWYAANLRLEEAVKERRISLGITRDLAAEFPSDEGCRRAFARDNYGLGRRLAGVGKFDEAEKYNFAAVSAGGQPNASARVVRRQRYAYVLFRLARYDEAERVLQEALDIAEQELAPKASPPNVNWWRSS